MDGWMDEGVDMLRSGCVKKWMGGWECGSGSISIKEN
jgi:hypothetical protein